MKCKKCNKEIDDTEVLCKECEKELKKISSKKEVYELESLIDEQLNLTKEDNTKELNDLNELVSDIKEEDSFDKKDNGLEIKTREEFRSEKKKFKINKKIIIIVASLILLILVILLLVYFKNKPEEVEVKVDYEKVINDYGNLLETSIGNYYSEKGKFPSFEYVYNLNKNYKYEIECSTHYIYEDGKLYLNDCKVDGKNVKYSYGSIEEVKESKKITIYKLEYDNEYKYFDYNHVGSEKVGSITCEADECELFLAYDKLAIINEESRYNLYNYETDSKLFGPFDINKELYYQNLIFYNNNLYGIYYNTNSIYSTSSNKSYSNIKGTMLYDMSDEISIIYKYGYVIFNNNGVNEFINLNTGNISYKIPGIIKKIQEDKNNKLVYMLVYESANSNSFSIYNSNGKELFNGKKFTKFIFNENNILVSDDSAFSTYDSKLNLKTKSKTYDKVIELYDEFVVVVEDEHLKIVDIGDKELAKFDLKWNTDRYIYNGIDTKEINNGIYLLIEDKMVPSGEGHILKCYYIPSTNEIGVIYSY